MRVALLPRHRSAGAVSLLWGVGFAAFIWALLRGVGVGQARAIAFAVVAGAGIALFVYLRGAGLERPPEEQPGAFLRRARARARARPRGARASSLLHAQVALDRGDLDEALFQLREARRVAVAQGRPDDLPEVQALGASLAARSGGRTRDAAGRLLAEVASDLRAAAPEAEVEVTVAELRARAEPRPPETRELTRARKALAGGDLATALFLLREARAAAAAQRRLGELLDVHELAGELRGRADGRTRAAADAVVRRAETDLRTFAR